MTTLFGPNFDVLSSKQGVHLGGYRPIHVAL
jgi:hypothetical protein